MAVRSKEELLGDLKGLRTDENEEAFITILENISDTLDGASAEESAKKIEELELSVKNLQEALEAKEKEWRNKFIERFYEGDKREAKTEEKAEEKIEEVDKDGDGKISEKELVEEWKEQSK